jgi:cell wall-associated NlpC family hydrolase
MRRPAEIVAIARETIGTPYLHQQRVNGLALDCAGVPVHVAKRIGMSFDDITNYGRLPVPAEMRRVLDANLTRVPKEQMQFGDVAWLKFRHEPQHFGILGDYHLGGFSLIHAYNGSGLHKVVEHRLDEQWAERIVAVWRFPGVEA